MPLLTERTRTVRVMNAVAAGTTNQNGTAVDMLAGGQFRGVRFTALFGALTATQVTSLKVQGSADNITFSDLAGTNTAALADGDGNKMLISEVYRPTYRYVRPVVLRATANAAIDGVIAELFEPGTEPTTQDTSVSASKQNISPAAGTA
jgi:hypothetical protein